ncbi:type III secretion low calcium response protein [Vibrio sp. JCM 18904]|nr:type III secretion low calcium response protein [Vibrio sp. JCM 18904]
MKTKLILSLAQAGGIEVTPYFWQQSEIQLGYRIEVEGLELVFRMEDGEIIIVLLKRVRPKLGLSNPPFAGLFLLAEHAIQLYPSDWVIRGNVDVLRGSNMSSQRLAQFYLKACGASMMS